MKSFWLYAIILTALASPAMSAEDGTGKSSLEIPKGFSDWLESLRLMDKGVMLTYRWGMSAEKGNAADAPLPIFVQMERKGEWLVWCSNGADNWSATGFSDGKCYFFHNALKIGSSQTLIYDTEAKKKEESRIGRVAPRFTDRTGFDQPNPALMELRFLLLGVLDYDGKPAIHTVRNLRWDDLQVPETHTAFLKCAKSVSDKTVIIGGTDAMGEVVRPDIQVDKNGDVAVKYKAKLPDATFHFGDQVCGGRTFKVITLADVELPWITTSVPFEHGENNPTMHYKFEYKEMGGTLLPSSIELQKPDRSLIVRFVLIADNWKTLPRGVPLKDASLRTNIVGLAGETKDVVDVISGMHVDE